MQMFSQSFNGADARHLVALFNAADVSSARGKEHVFLSHAPCRAKLPQRTTKVSLRRNILSGKHLPDFRRM